MSCGLRELQTHVPAADSVVVHRLRSAGARIAAVTNMDALGMAASGETSGYWVTTNPFDPTRTAGGSSSGAAAGLYLPQIDAALGTDQGGSVRVPASWCGVLGMKPTHGIVPYRGNAGIHSVLDHVGPLARTAEQLASMMDALTSDTSAGRTVSNPAPGHTYRAAVEHAPVRLRGTRIALLREAMGTECEEPVARGIHEAAARLEMLGARLRIVEVPEHLKVEDASGWLNALGIADLLDHRVIGPAGPRFSRELIRSIKQDGASVSPQVKAAWIAGVRLGSDRSRVLNAVRRARRQLAAAYDRALNEVDVLFLPTTPHPAFVVPSVPSVSGLVRRGWTMLRHTEPFNLTGHPALSVPVGIVEVSGRRLPAGGMFIGRMFDDARLLSLAATYERGFGWQTPTAHRRPMKTVDDR